MIEKIKPITPAIAKDVAVIEKEITKVVIKTEQDLEKASALRENAKKILKSIKLEKDKIIEPAKLIVKTENARWKKVEDMLESGVEVINKAMTVYMTKVREEEAKKADKIIDKLDNGEISPEKAVAKLDSLKKADNKVSTGVGSTSFIPVDCFEMTDARLVPVEYLILDEVKVRALLKAGQKVEGVRYWVEQRPRSGR